MTPTAILFRAEAVIRRNLRTPVTAGAHLSSDNPEVEERLLVHSLAQRVAGELLYYPGDVSLEALRVARGLLKTRPKGSLKAGKRHQSRREVPEKEEPAPQAPTGLLSRRRLPLVASLAALGACLLLLWGLTAGRARADDVRVDHFDSRSQRAGHSVVDTKSGRVDHFDVRSRRTGGGLIEEGRKAEDRRREYDRHTSKSGKRR